ncbi:MAG: zinc-binding dehydrogenase [Candidatus Sericytochromatia bacterium]|nr:zinc-binding dehydrogenase [Candidatus Tanganyikabacteria bacterium]
MTTTRTPSSSPSPIGLHRVLTPAGVLPYDAERLDAAAALAEGEAEIRVDTLNIDSASFTQLLAEGAGDPGHVARRVTQIVDERGKMHNPVTGSGGVLCGTVKAVGAGSPARVGARIVTLSSLTTTPLELERIVEVRPERHQIRVEGRAVLYARTPFAELDDRLPEALALGVLDVCGAPAQAARLAKPGATIAVLGAAGKSGTLVCWVAAAQGARVVALVRSPEEAAHLAAMGIALDCAVVDGRNAVAVQDAVSRMTHGAMADVTFNCVNVPGVEMSCILATRQRGIVYFFSMATSFQAAALGGEALGADVDLMIGNGFAEGHAAMALDLVAANPPLRAALERLGRA